MPQSYTRLLYHVVFSTKKRDPLIDATWRTDLHDYIGGIVRNRKGELLAAGGIADHIHLLLQLPPTRSLSDVVRDIKANSSTWVREHHLKEFTWQEGYSAFTLGAAAIPRVMAYINNQETHHKSESLQAEFLNLLNENEITYTNDNSE